MMHAAQSIFIYETEHICYYFFCFLNKLQQPPSMTPEQQQMNLMQRSAQNLVANSNTYYITTDSTFGNHILPVIPRIDNSHSK